MNNIIVNQPDDWHVHLRDGEYLRHTVPDSATHFGKVLVMPNLKPALTHATLINEYRNRILENAPKNTSFNPYMTFILNEKVTPEQLQLAKNYSYILGAKLYPAGATTNSEEGVKSLTKLYPLLEIMQNNDLVLQIHGEVTHGDIFDRERLFLTEYLAPLINNFPNLRIVLEHISTKAAVDFYS